MQPMTKVVYAGLLSLLDLVNLLVNWTVAAATLLAGLSLGVQHASSNRYLLTGAVGIVHLLVFGIFSTRIPKNRLRGPLRQARMRGQRGHTLMLLYFIGVAPVTEAFFVITRKAGPTRLWKALKLQSFGVVLPHIILQTYMVWVTSLLPMEEQEKLLFHPNASLVHMLQCAWLLSLCCGICYCFLILFLRPGTVAAKDA